ncbi:MAG: acyloxyacyl hydrolase [Bacteroidota bacterium]
MYRAFPILLLSFFLASHLTPASAQIGIHGGLRYGRILEVLPKFPAINSPGIMVFGGIHGSTGQNPDNWGQYLGRPDWSIDFSYENFGNTEVLGHGIGVLPSLHFFLKRKDRIQYTMQLGWGLAYISQPYDKLNTENQIIGSSFNFMAILGFHARIKTASQWWLVPGVSISHYSNGGFANPNIGVNIPSGSLAIQWDRSKPTSTVARATKTPLKRWRIRPFVRGGLGFTEQSFDGPKFKVYSIAFGAHTRAGQISLLKLGAEYSFSQASLAFIEQVGLYPGDERRQASRWAIFGSHDLLFGYFAFHTEAGIYVQDHHDRQSMITTRIGFTFFGRNSLKVQGQLPGIGLYVRAYEGEADYLELALLHAF